MESKEAKLAKLNFELEDVKKQIKEIESIPYASRSTEDKKLLHDYVDKEKRLNDKIDALEGSL